MKQINYLFFILIPLIPLRIQSMDSSTDDIFRRPKGAFPQINHLLIPIVKPKRISRENPQPEKPQTTETEINKQKTK